MTRVVQGVFSSAASPDRLVIRTQQQLLQAWGLIFSSVSVPPQPPAVDFSGEMVIVVLAGAKPTSGFCIAVTGAAGNRRSMEVQVRSGSPGPLNGVLPVVIHPFDVVRVPIRDEVTFRDTFVVGEACSSEF